MSDTKVVTEEVDNNPTSNIVINEDVINNTDKSKTVKGKSDVNVHNIQKISNIVHNIQKISNRHIDNKHLDTTFTEALERLDFETRKWASNLTPNDLACVLQTVYKGITESLKSTPKSQKAADIGKQGEQDFAKMCKTLPENYKIINTAKQGKQGDFIITYTNNNQTKRCLVDIKKYSTTVPKKEIDKFYEDLTYGSYDAGLIVSYSSNFAGISDNIFLEDKQLINGTIPVMYIANVHAELILQCVKVLMMKTLVLDACDIRLSRIECFINSINNTLSQSASTRRLLSEMQFEISKSIQRCQENLVSLEVQTKKSIKEINKVIEDEKLIQLKQSIPKLQERDDNIEDIKVQPDKDLEVQEKKSTSKAEDEEKNGSELSDSELSDTIINAVEKFRKKDQTIIITLIEHNINCNIQEEYLQFTYDTIKTATQSSKCVNLILKPLKTKTNVILCIPKSCVRYVPEEFVERGSVESNDVIIRNIDLLRADKSFVVYTGSLNSDILSFVESTMSQDS